MTGEYLRGRVLASPCMVHPYQEFNASKTQKQVVGRAELLSRSLNPTADPGRSRYHILHKPIDECPTRPVVAVILSSPWYKKETPRHEIEGQSDAQRRCILDDEDLDEVVGIRRKKAIPLSLLFLVPKNIEHYQRRNISKGKKAIATWGYTPMLPHQ